MLVEAVAALREPRRRRPTLVLAGEAGPAGDVVDALVDRHGSATSSSGSVRSASPSCSTLLRDCRRVRARLPRRRRRRPRRHPQRARRGDGRRACRSSRPACRASPSCHRRRDGLLVPPEDPSALADCARPSGRRRTLRRRLAAAAAGAPSPTRFDGDVLARDLAALMGAASMSAVRRGRTAADRLRRRRATPRPRGRRRCRRRPLHPQRRHARRSAPHRTGWPAGSPATWSGGPSGSRRNEGLDLAHAYAVTGDDALPGRLAAAGRRRTSTRCPSGTTAPRSRPGGCRTGCTPGSGSATPEPPVDPDVVGDAGRPPARRRRPPRRPPHAGAQPPHARAVRAAARRARPRRPRAGDRRRSPTSPTTPSATSCPTASIASARATTT